MDDEADARTGGEHVYRALVEAGVELLVGIPGTQTLPLDRVVAERDEVQYVMARHETAIPHVAWGYYEVSGRPAATLTVPGPGETNAMHGLKNALEDSVPILHVTGDAHPDDVGKGPIHEIEPETYDTVVKENVRVASAVDLPAEVTRGIERALSPPYGPVRLGVPSKLLDAEVTAPEATVEPERVTRDNAGAYDVGADLLADAERPVLYVGGGTRRAEDGPEAVEALADALDAAVVTTYKGKGVFPEDDPRFLGVSGGSLPPGAVAALEAADVVVGLGTDFDGLGTRNWSLPLGERLVHVTLDPADVGAGYDPDVPIVDDAARAADALRERLADRDAASGGANAPDRWDPAGVGTAVREEFDDRLRELGLLGDGPPLHTPAVLRTVREATPDDAVVTADVGGFRLWAMQVFEAYDPRRFVAAGSWAGMGVGLPAAIGAGLAEPDLPVVCLSGDGGLLMCVHELATAAEEDLDITLVVSNNADYGIISKKPKIRDRVDDHAFTWASPDFPAIAEGFGWEGVSVETATELERAVEESIAGDGPTLIDVDVPTEEPSAGEAADFETDLAF